MSKERFRAHVGHLLHACAWDPGPGKPAIVAQVFQALIDFHPEHLEHGQSFVRLYAKAAVKLHEMWEQRRLFQPAHLCVLREFERLTAGANRCRAQTAQGRPCPRRRLLPTDRCCQHLPPYQVRLAALQRHLDPDSARVVLSMF